MSYFDVSLETANKFYTWGWRGSIIGAVITAVAVVFLMWGTSIRDHEAEKELTGAKTGAAQANERAASLEVTAAGLKKEAEEARLEQEKIKAGLAWRTIPQLTLTNLAMHLQGQKGSVLFAHTANDPESLYLVIQLAKAFEHAGWTISSEARTYPDRIMFGLTISDPSNTKTAFVKSAFQQAGIPFNAGLVPQPPISFNSPTTPQDVTIMVGSKPPN